jgi:D-sedoheptulose 7-phosphate isomerase
MSPDAHSVDLIRARLGESAAVKQAMRSDEDFTSTLADIAAVIVAAFQAGRKVLLCGNGGSAADAEHIATEFVGRFSARREPLAAIALTANTSCLTAIGNDFTFDEVFARQVKGLGDPGDVVIGISTSGSAENVVRAIDAAKARGLVTVAFTGAKGGRLRDRVEYCLRIPSDVTPRIQEGHITAAHIVCEIVEQALLDHGT